MPFNFLMLWNDHRIGPEDYLCQSLDWYLEACCRYLRITQPAKFAFPPCRFAGKRLIRKKFLKMQSNFPTKDKKELTMAAYSPIRLKIQRKCNHFMLNIWFCWRLNCRNTTKTRMQRFSNRNTGWGHEFFAFAHMFVN